MSQVVIILGSESDLGIVKESKMLEVLDEIGVSWELSIISAHRNSEELQNYCMEKYKYPCRGRADKDKDAEVFIGVAGMAAALPGVIASHVRCCPVIGVPLVSSDIPSGLDALYSMVRMPAGVPVAVPGIGKPGLYNAALLACQIIALNSKKPEKICGALLMICRVNQLSSLLNHLV